MTLQQRALRRLSSEQLAEIRDCHPENKLECYCDSTHAQNETVCMFCWYTLPYTFKDIETGKIRTTQGRFSHWTGPTGTFGFNYAVFHNARSDILIPAHCLTPLTKRRIGKPPEAIAHA